MEPLLSLIAGSLAFVGTHFALSHPLRAPLVGAIGENGFRAAYSLVSLATFFWAVMAFRAVAPGGTLAVGGSISCDGTFVTTQSTINAGTPIENPAIVRFAEVAEKQALVEAADLTARARVLTTLLSINAAESGDEDTPPSLQ